MGRGVSRRAPSLVLVDARPRTAALAALSAAVEATSSTARVPIRFAGPGPDLVRAVERARADGFVVVGWSLTTASARAQAAALRALREVMPPFDDVLHVAGGPHPTADPEGTLGLGFDLAAVGEGEGTLVGLLGRLVEGKRPTGEGLAWLEGGRVRSGGRAPPVDLDAFPPFPSRLRRLGPVEITRGCDHACRFCQTTHLHGGRVRHRSPDVVARAAGDVVRRGGRDVRFVTPSALAYGSSDGVPRLDRVEELLSRVRREAGPSARLWLGTFPSEVRPEHVTAEALALLRRFVANDHLVVGAQSGSDAMLAACHRGHGVEDVRRAVRLALAAGFRVQVDLIFGLPGESGDDAARSRELAEELASAGAGIHAHAFLPLPGTPWADATPGRIDDETRRLLERLAGSGRVSGPWRRQEAMAAAP
jgi:B12-binding domain/radical SAM domain protein